MSDLLLEVPDLATRVQTGGRGILDVAPALPDGWENGISFRTGACLEPVIAAACVVIEGFEGERPSEILPQFEPIWIRQSAACALMSLVGTTDLAQNRLAGTTEWGLGRLLATGAGGSNPSLTDAEVVTAQDDAVGAVSCIEQAAADTGYGVEVFLHAPMRAAAYLRRDYLIDEQGRSPAGFRWIISPGYPAGVDSGSDTLVNIWATGTVWASADAPYTLSDGMTGRSPGWRQNLDEAIAQRLALAAFDPCLNLTATFAVPACTGGS